MLRLLFKVPFWWLKTTIRKWPGLAVGAVTSGVMFLTSIQGGFFLASFHRGDSTTTDLWHVLAGSVIPTGDGWALPIIVAFFLHYLSTRKK